MTLSTHDESQPPLELRTQEIEVSTPVIEATGIGVEASWGHIYGPIDLTVRRGGLTILAGAGGRGRVALMLTLAGRMKPSSGTLTAFGQENDARHLYDQSAIAHIDELDGISQAIRVHDLITEQVRWAAPWYRWVRQSRQSDLEEICRPVFGDYSLPSLDAFVEELPELSAALLRIAVANVRRPPLLVVGGVDRLSSVVSTQILIDRLADLGRHQTVITADINGGFGSERVREVIAVPNLTNREFVRLEREGIE